MPASRTDATGSASNDIAPATAAQAISTPVADRRPCSAAATVPTARNAAKPTGRAKGAGMPRCRWPRVIPCYFSAATREYHRP